MDELKNIRSGLELSQSAMAQRIGVTLSYYQKVEQGVVPAGAGFIRLFKVAFPKISADLFFK